MFALVQRIINVLLINVLPGKFHPLLTANYGRAQEQEVVEIGQALRRATWLAARSIEQSMTEVNTWYEALCMLRNELKDHLSAIHLTDTVIGELPQVVQDISIGIENTDFETKRCNLQLLKVGVTVDKGIFTINCIVGVISGELRKLPKALKDGIASDLH
jgi:hypothetical protein